jgi:hypothetical protein
MVGGAEREHAPPRDHVRDQSGEVHRIDQRDALAGRLQEADKGEEKR